MKSNPRSGKAQIKKRSRIEDVQRKNRKIKNNWQKIRKKNMCGELWIDKLKGKQKTPFTRK